MYIQYTKHTFVYTIKSNGGILKMTDVYTVKKFGNGFHVVLPKGKYKDGQDVLVTDDRFMNDMLNDIQRKEVKLLIQEAIQREKQGY